MYLLDLLDMIIFHSISFIISCPSFYCLIKCNLSKNIEVKRKGLGTPTTRAGIIENLIAKGYIERDKKNLIATHKGISLVTIVSDRFKSAKTTAEWEMKLSEISSGKARKYDFLQGIVKEIREEICKYS